jgi:hypothetical protein
MIVGKKEVFAFEIKEQTDDQLRNVDIYIAGHNASCRDNTVYVPFFVNALHHKATRLKYKFDYFAYEDIFFGKSVSEAHRIIAQSILNQYQESYSETAEFLSDKFVKYWDDVLGDWGETTDGVFSFLFPLHGKLHLTLEYRDENHQPKEEIGEIFATEITPYEIIRVCEMAVKILDPEEFYLSR